jgi:hypothetical protein
VTWVLRLDPPFDPSPEEGRGLLRRELLDPEYHRDDVVGRLLAWLQRVLGNLLDAASGAPPLSTFAAMAVGLMLVLSLIWLVTRARASPRSLSTPGAVLPDESISASEWRERAERAHAEERYSEALVEAFRALAAGQVEQGGLSESPGATAHEVAEALRAAYPHQAAGMSEAARLFDLVLYGDRAATREQAELLLSLDAKLAGAR